jgi:hypothetical protein
MQMFDYVIVLISIVIGLAPTDRMQGIAARHTLVRSEWGEKTAVQLRTADALERSNRTGEMRQ